jgi:hypothetical protein
MEKKFMRSVFGVLNDFNVSVSSTLKERGIEAAKMVISKTTMLSGLGDVLQRLYVFVGVAYANSTYKEVQRSAREPKSKKAAFIQFPLNTTGSQISFNDIWARDIIQYFRMYLLDKAVVPVTIQSKEIAMGILEKGSNEGWSIERMAKELEEKVEHMWRARLIVRTETAKAAFYGRRIGAADSGFETEKEWVTSEDSRVRNSHREMDGEIIEYNQKYQVPIYRGNVRAGQEMMRGPGDPDASAGNVCNCRCTEAYKARRDANGRLIRKPTSRVSVIQPGQIQRPLTTVTI